MKPTPNATSHTEIAVFAGGCFWGMEDILAKQAGVLETSVGYTGGTTASPTYEAVKKGTTGHAEAVRVVFDPARLSYENLLRLFFTMHDPTTPNRQGNDIGTQYRSAIFAMTDAQREAALKIKKEFEGIKYWNKPIATEIMPAMPFTPAEEYHQDYLKKNPGGYTCHYVRKF